MSNDLVKRLKIKAEVMEMGEKIAWGSDTALMREAAETIRMLEQDKKRLDWLADPTNNIGNVQLPTSCVENNLHSLRDAIDAAMMMPNTSLCTNKGV